MIHPARSSGGSTRRDSSSSIPTRIETIHAIARTLTRPYRTPPERRRAAIPDQGLLLVVSSTSTHAVVSAFGAPTFELWHVVNGVIIPLSLRSSLPKASTVRQALAVRNSTLPGGFTSRSRSARSLVTGAWSARRPKAASFSAADNVDLFFFRTYSTLFKCAASRGDEHKNAKSQSPARVMRAMMSHQTQTRPCRISNSAIAGRQPPV